MQICNNNSNNFHKMLGATVRGANLRGERTLVGAYNYCNYWSILYSRIFTITFTRCASFCLCFLRTTICFLHLYFISLLNCCTATFKHFLFYINCVVSFLHFLRQLSWLNSYERLPVVARNAVTRLLPSLDWKHNSWLSKHQLVICSLFFV